MFVCVRVSERVCAPMCVRICVCVCLFTATETLTLIAKILLHKSSECIVLLRAPSSHAQAYLSHSPMLHPQILHTVCHTQADFCRNTQAHFCRNTHTRAINAHTRAFSYVHTHTCTRTHTCTHTCTCLCRGLILYELDKFEDCITDLKAAIKNSPPVDIIPDW